MDKETQLQQLSEETSRRERHLQKSAKKNIFFVLGGIIFFCVVLFFFGVPFLVGFSTFIGDVQQDNPEPTLKEKIYIAPPTLDVPFEATKNEKVTITGNVAGEDLTVDLYVNNMLVESTKVKGDGSFSFSLIKLEKGGNIIKAKAVSKKNVASAFSQSVIITYRDSAPEIEITSPSDGETIKKEKSPITVAGKTDEGNKVTVNDFWAVVDASGEFSYRLPLQSGENKIIVIATDDAENKTTKELTIKVED